MSSVRSLRDCCSGLRVTIRARTYKDRPVLGVPCVKGKWKAKEKGLGTRGCGRPFARGVGAAAVLASHASHASPPAELRKRYVLWKRCPVDTSTWEYCSPPQARPELEAFYRHIGATVTWA